MKNTLLYILVSWGLCSIVQGQSTGCIRGNCTNGMGTYLWDSGDEYTGQWFNGKRTGLGVYDWVDGSYYFGYFQDGMLEGKGIYIAKEEKDDKVGYFSNGQYSSSYNFAETGCLMGDCTNGVGIYLWESDDIYIGEWVGGNRTGYGRYDWADGSWYIGYFKDGNLHGDGEYHGKDNNDMTGIFSNNEFQGSSQAKPAAQPVSGAVSGKTTTVSEADFCSTLQAVVKAYANNFEAVKGRLIPPGDFSLTDQWESNVRIAGTAEAEVVGGFLGSNNTWHNDLYTGKSWDDAYNQYKSYVNLVKDCRTNCCTMVSDEHVYDKDNYRSTSTSWLTFLVNDGWDDVYEELLIEVEVSSDIIDDGFNVVLRVSRFERD